MSHAIFLCVTKDFVPLLRISLASIKEFYPDHPEVIIVYSGLDRYTRLELQRFGKTSLVENPFSVADCGPIMGHLKDKADPRAFYARFLIWTDFFDSYENVLHLDVDTIIKGDLTDLLRKDMFLLFQESYKGHDHTFKDSGDITLIRKLFEDGIQIDGNRGNAGVFLVPKRYRTADNFNELRYLQNRYKNEIKWADQSIINLWMVKHGIKTSMSHEYNFQHRWFYDIEGYLKAKILHFNGLVGQERENLMHEHWRTIYATRKQVA